MNSTLTGGTSRGSFKRRDRDSNAARVAIVSERQRTTCTERKEEEVGGASHPFDRLLVAANRSAESARTRQEVRRAAT